MTRVFRWVALTLYFLQAAVIGHEAFADDRETTKILLIGKQPDHSFGTHMYLHTQAMLAKCLERTKGIQTEVSDGWPQDAAVLQDVDTIVLYSTPGAEYLIDGSAGGDFHQMMRRGTGLVTLHWASSVFEKNLDRLGDQWMSYLGGTWVSNYGLSTTRSPLKQLIPDHPICRGWQEYDLHDEFYLNPVIRDANPLLQVTTAGQDVVVGWVHERDSGGRACATTLGHFYRNFQIESFRRMVVNSILWTAHVDIPPDGAPVNLSEEELNLPPRPEE